MAVLGGLNRSWCVSVPGTRRTQKRRISAGWPVACDIHSFSLSLSFVLFSLSNSDTVWPIQMKIKKYIYITAYWIHRKRMPLGVVLYACMCYAYSVAFELSIFSALCMREKRNNTRDTHTHTCTKYSGLRETVALLGSDRRSCRGEHIVEFSTLSQSKVEICGCLFVSN